MTSSCESVAIGDRPHITSTSAIKARADILEVATALGCKVYGNRATAAWRGGDGLTVSLDQPRGLFYDHRDSRGGDVLSLIMLSLGCGFVEALRWLASFYGFDLKRSDTTAGLRGATVRSAAEALAEWRWRLTQGLKAVAISIERDCRVVARWTDMQSDFSDDPRWELFSQERELLNIAEGIDSYAGRLRDLPARQLVGLRGRLEGAR